MFSRTRGYVFVLFLAMTSCLSRLTKHTEVKPPSKIEESFSFYTSKKFIGIKRSSLDKEFLLNIIELQQTPIRVFEGLKSRIVAFKQYGENIFMLETNQGHQIVDDIQTQLVIAKFPIKISTEKTIYFDFNEGMSQLLIARGITGSDLTGNDYVSNETMTIPIENCFLSKMEIDKENNLIISQVSQGIINRGTVSYKVPIELRYYLSPYIENSDFKPKKSPGYEKVGYFEVKPQLQGDGKLQSTLIYATKHNLHKPITFYISANTPQEYRKSIREGALYWNLAFGSEIIAVEDAPLGISAPDFHYNIIQWVDWKDAGLAYSDMEANPRTGEILHAQIFLTNFFVENSKNQAISHLNNLLNDATISEDRSQKTNHLCQLNPLTSVHFFLSQQNLFSMVSDEALIKRTIHDSLRANVAHEFGHTLGLRHNFAGSLFTKATPQTIKEVFANYLKSGNVPAELTLTSSVMDYLPYQLNALVGRQLIERAEAFEYDKEAIRYLYNIDEDPITKQLPPFCTDTQKGHYWDCLAFDEGASPLEFFYSQDQFLRKNLPSILFSSLTEEKSKSHKPIESFFPPSSHLGQFLNTTRIPFYLLMNENPTFIRVRNLYPYVSGLNQSEILAKEKLYLVAEIDRLGGLKKLLDENHFVKIWSDEFKKRIEAKTYQTGIGSSKSEQDLLKKRVDIYFQEIGNHAKIQELILLDKIIQGVNSNIPEIIQESLIEKLKPYILDHLGENTEIVTTKDEKKITFHMLKFSYPFEVRMTAAKKIRMLAESSPLWMRKKRVDLYIELQNKLNTAIENHDINSINMHALSKGVEPLFKWIFENKTLLKTLEPHGT